MEENQVSLSNCAAKCITDMVATELDTLHRKMEDLELRCGKCKVKVEPGENGFGPEIDRYLGRCPYDGPGPGYVLNKITYEKSFNNAAELHASYRVTPDHIGVVGNFLNGARSVEAINEDQVGGAGISNEARLVPGDYILGAVLVGIDSRVVNQRVGTVTAGVVPVSSGVRASGGAVMYGSFTGAEDKAIILTTALQGAVTNNVLRTNYAIAHTGGLNMINPPRLGSVLTNEQAAPSLSVIYSGVPRSMAFHVKAKLIVYALTAQRSTGVSNASPPDPTFSLETVCGMRSDGFAKIIT
jgi:hypothetical protein